MNGTHQVLAYLDDVNSKGDVIRTIERNADLLLSDFKVTDLAINIGKTMYMEVGRHRGKCAYQGKSLIFNFALKFSVRKVQENNLDLGMNGTHQVLAYADDVNLIYIHIM